MRKWFDIFGKVVFSIILFFLYAFAFWIMVSIVFTLAAASLILMWLLVAVLGIVCLRAYLEIALAVWGW